MRHLVFNTAARALLVVSLLAGQCHAARAQARGEAGQATRAAPDHTKARALSLVREAAQPLTGDARDYDALLGLIGDAHVVMLGEQTHGTHEFYRERARITRRLVEEKGFDTIVLEADWPDAYRVNRYVQGAGSDEGAEDALSGFKRFPRWMWRNTDFRDFVQWVRAHNDARRPGAEPVRVLGMDLYSLGDSADAVIRYLKAADPEAARRARKRYGCFRRYHAEPQLYGQDVAAGLTRTCEREVREQFREMEERAGRGEGRPDAELLSAHQNARVVKNGEAYYRTIFGGGISSWNLRDGHMAETLNALIEGQGGGRRAKVVVWAHNTHQGDARMTEKALAGELSVGQLMRQRHGERSVLIGFTTYTGTVRAASEWGGPDERKRVRPALDGSFAALFHEAGVPNFLLLLRGGGELTEELSRYRLERAIGVLYLTRTERTSHYFFARLGRQFDAVIHLDVTTAIERL